MKRIYKNNDLAFNLTINNFPINKDLINSIEFKFYTLNQSNYILKTQDDIDIYNQVILEWNELRKLEEGVLFYDYKLSLKNEEMNDGTEDTVNKIMTNYYIVTGNETIDINSDMANYYTKDEVDDLIANVESGEVDLTKYYTKSQIDIKLNGYVQDDVLGSYYTKNEVNDLIDNINIPTGGTNVDMSNYYTKTEVNNLIPTDYINEIPSEYITESELNDKGYLTEHQSLSNYYTKSEVDNKINNSGNFDSTQYYTKSEVDNKIPTNYLTSIPSEYITETELTEKGYLTQHQSLDNYYTKGEVDNKIPTDYIKTIPSEYITETELNTSLNGYSTTSHTHSEYITEQYDDTALANRVSALETELNGVSEQITELNNMVV